MELNEAEKILNESGYMIVEDVDYENLTSGTRVKNDFDAVFGPVIKFCKQNDIEVSFPDKKRFTMRVKLPNGSTGTLQADMRFGNTKFDGWRLTIEDNDMDYYNRYGVFPDICFSADSTQDLYKRFDRAMHYHDNEN